MKDIWKHACGCALKQDTVVWTLKEYCAIHEPNYQKRGNKQIHAVEKTRKRRIFLEERRKRKINERT